MRISDWSSDVCSSDLEERQCGAGRQPGGRCGDIGAGVSPRRRLHSRGTFDGCDEIEEASVVSGELVVPGCDASEVFDLVEEAFDEITFFVEMGVEAAPLRGRSEERRVGKECVSTSRSRWAP